MPAEGPSDIFSVGSVLYELVTGKRPFGRRTAAETVAAILKEDPAPIAASGVEIPPALERVILRCLEREPSNRYQSARDLAFDLRAVQSGSGVAPVLPPPSRRLTVALAAVLYLLGLWPGVAEKPADSIAVLPFDAAGGDPDAEYLGDGIAEGVINSLTQAPGLRVIARTTAFRFKGQEVDPGQIGRQLNVRLLLTGRILLRGDMVTIQADLVDAATGSQLWGYQYNRRLSDLIAVQEEIAGEIADRLRLRLTGEQRERLTRRQTRDPEAYQLYLKGRYQWSKRTPEGLAKGIEHFEEAVKKDPGYALAWAGLADCYNLRSMYAGEPPGDSFARAKAAVLEALKIDERLGEAHTSLANMMTLHEWDWAGAERQFHRSIELSPGYATAHHSYAFFLAAMKRHPEALASIRRAQSLDPLSLIINAAVARILYGARRYDQAIEQCRKTLDMDAGFAQAHLVLGDVYLKKRMFAEAIAAYEKGAAGNLDTSPELAHGYAVAGRGGQARRILANLVKLSGERYVSPYDIGWIYAGLGEHGEALRWLEKAYQGRSESLVYMQVEPLFDNLRSEPGFRELVRRMGLPP